MNLTRNVQVMVSTVVVVVDGGGTFASHESHRPCYSDPELIPYTAVMKSLTDPGDPTCNSLRHQ